MTLVDRDEWIRRREERKRDARVANTKRFSKVRTEKRRKEAAKPPPPIRAQHKQHGGFDKGHKLSPGNTRKKLVHKFIYDLQEHWEKHGVVALNEMFKNDPAAYVRVIAQIIPKEMKVETDIGQNLADLIREVSETRQQRLEAPEVIDVDAEEVEDGGSAEVPDEDS